MNNTFAPPLEQYIDRAGLFGAVALLSTICAEKAEHIRTNWQDAALASKWDNAATKLANLSETFYRQSL
jgi:hypothetical protein